MIIISSLVSVWNNVWPYLVAIISFLILIVIHEFGHFIAAKLLGVKVNEFAVGFGPKLFSKQWGETRYSFCLFPLGGFCAMEGEDSESGDDRAFCNKKPWRRFLIVVMGAVFNLLFGLILVAIILAPTKTFTTTKIADFHEGAISSQYGLKVDDEIVRVDSRRIFTTYDLSYAFTNVKDGEIDIEVLRDGKKVKLDNVKFESKTEKDISYLTVDFYVYGQEKTAGSFISQTFKTAISHCAVIWRSLIDLLTGKFGISAMSGPVGVTTVMSSAVQRSLPELLQILALITINLGIFNLLPLPALDGGRLLFITFEMIFRRSVSQKYEALVHGIGFAILLCLMLLITAKDIFTLITG